MTRRHARRALLVCGVGLMLLPTLAPATIEEQRARLPAPATNCSDPVAGIWMSHKYEGFQLYWYVFTLRIQRHVDGTLYGDITSHSWNSSPREPEPPPCRPGLDHWVVAMTAEGTANGLNVDFHGTSWRLGQVFCGPPTGPGGYNLDRFTGTIDPTIQEFQSVNNDGGDMVNDPTVFRRVRCLEPDAPPHPYVAPPPTFRPRRGCGRSFSR